MIPAPTAPVLSLNERDRRRSLVETLLVEEDLAAIIVFPGGAERLERYLTNEINNGTVILVAGREPVYVVGRHPLPRFDAIGRLYERWVEDIRLGNAVEIARELVAEVPPGRRVGIVGRSSRSVGAGAGTIPAGVWAPFADAFAAYELVDVSIAFEHLVLVKSDEELAMMRYSAELGERACAGFVTASRAGRPESESLAAAFAAMVAGGGEITGPVIQRSGSDRFGWAAPEWVAMGGGSRVLRAGDTNSAEIFSHYAGYQTQQQIDVSIGEPDVLLRELEAVCIESYRIGVGMIRPGVRFGDIAAAMEAPVIDAGFWNTGPQIQTVSPVMYNSATHQNTHVDPRLRALPYMPPTVPQDGDFVLEKGIVFAVQPNALLGGRRVSIGGAVITGAEGAEELNTIPLALNVVEA